MKRESLVSQIALITLAVCLAALAMLGGCSCGRVNKDDVKNPVMVRPTEGAETQNPQLGEASEEDLRAAEHKGYTDGLLDGQKWLRNNPKHGLVVSVEYPKDHGGYRQYDEIVSYNEGCLASYQKAMEYEANPP